MAVLLDLPAETLVQISQHVNLNGDLSRFRQVNSRLNDISQGQSRHFLDNLRRRYGLRSHIVDLYFRRKLESSASKSNEPRLANVLALDHLLRSMETLAEDVDRALRSRTNIHEIHAPHIDRESFLLFAILSHLLRLSQTVLSMTGTVLAPCSSGETFAPKLLGPGFVQFVQHELELSDLESIISVINVCATKLWSTIFLFRPKDSTVSSFGSLSGYSFNTDQAILTEHVIWKGPKWVSQILTRYGASSVDKGDASSMARDHEERNDQIVTEGVWRGSHENGALLAANGVARLLWKERQQKIEQVKRGDVVQAVAITNMQTNPVVWRGSAGDM
ncbi:hypothetical protein LTR84_004802 [Exophiala bonariae]|uniref:F-box domain-containing protein n=1 Tax=Exophiala bonariae TaxID=1690606 RepID=A0AAV9NNX0_9EURO|nr:hypothetical protein LTR84_004802 [Exophiala bonariae]